MNTEPRTSASAAAARARLARALTPHEAPGPELRFGTVIAITGQRLTVQIGGNLTDITEVPRLASYTGPAIGDRVAIIRADDDLLVIGKIA